MRVRIFADVFALFLVQRSEGRGLSEKLAIENRGETLMSEAESAVMCFATEDDWLAHQRKLEPGGSVNRHATVDKLEHVCRTDVFFRGDYAHVIGQRGKFSLDETLHAARRVIPCFDRVNL